MEIVVKREDITLEQIYFERNGNYAGFENFLNLNINLCRLDTVYLKKGDVVKFKQRNNEEKVKPFFKAFGED